MASLLLTMDGWSNGASGNNVRQYNNDASIFTPLPDAPELNTGYTYDTTFCHKGGWDGNRWYSISVSGQLFAYTPTTSGWSVPLVSGMVIISGTPVRAQQWVMASDGSYVYLLSSSNDFRRYDPSLDTLTALSTPPGSGGYTKQLFLTYDGSGSIYGSKGGGTNALISKYDIASDTWTALSLGEWSTLFSASANSATVGAYLQGYLWLILMDHGGALLRAYQYVPSGNVWVTKTSFSTTLNGRYTATSPAGEDSDRSIRIWPIVTTVGVLSQIYDIANDSWSTGAQSPIAFGEGTNASVTRLFSANFTWYQSDGTTALSTTANLGSASLGDTLTFNTKVKTPVARAAGVTVSVPVNTATDAEDPVTICATVGGTYGTSFTTGALNANDEFDVFIKVIPTSHQTLGLAKRFFLKVTPVG